MQKVIHLHMKFCSLLEGNNLKIVGLFPYTSHTMYEVYTQSHNVKTEYHDLLDKLWECLIIQARSINILSDNKIVFKCKIDKPKSYSYEESSYIYVGSYDGIVSVGLGIRQSDPYTQKFNQFFENEEIDLNSFVWVNVNEYGLKCLTIINFDFKRQTKEFNGVTYILFQLFEVINYFGIADWNKYLPINLKLIKWKQ